MGYWLWVKNPLTEQKADFVADLLVNEYWFIAAPGGEFANPAQVNRPGVKIGVGLNSSSGPIPKANFQICSSSCMASLQLMRYEAVR